MNFIVTAAIKIARQISDKIRPARYAAAARSSFPTERIFANFDALFLLPLAIFSALARYILADSEKKRRAEIRSASDRVMSKSAVFVEERKYAATFASRKSLYKLNKK